MLRTIDLFLLVCLLHVASAVYNVLPFETTERGAQHQKLMTQHLDDMVKTNIPRLLEATDKAFAKWDPYVMSAYLVAFKPEEMIHWLVGLDVALDILTSDDHQIFYTTYDSPKIKLDGKGGGPLPFLNDETENGDDVYFSHIDVNGAATYQANSVSTRSKYKRQSLIVMSPKQFFENMDNATSLKDIEKHGFRAPCSRMSIERVAHAESTLFHEVMLASDKTILDGPEEHRIYLQYNVFAAKIGNKVAHDLIMQSPEERNGGDDIQEWADADLRYVADAWKAVYRGILVALHKIDVGLSFFDGFTGMAMNKDNKEIELRDNLVKNMKLPLDMLPLGMDVESGRASHTGQKCRRQGGGQCGKGKTTEVESTPLGPKAPDAPKAPEGPGTVPGMHCRPASPKGPGLQRTGSIPTPVHFRG